MADALTLELASKFAQIALGHVTREFPNRLDHVLASLGDLQRPSTLHPAFHGSFDWHSCVHGYWLLATLYRRISGLPEGDRISALFDAQLTPDKIGGEVAYLARAECRSFERPYGWAWLLMLAAELKRHRSPEGRTWSAALGPLATAFAERFRLFLPSHPYPVRTGTHANTAFALTLAWEYAEAAEDAELTAIITDRASAWYGKDVRCQAWEPDGEAFLSPALIEAECMRRILPAASFGAWIRSFLPNIARKEPAALYSPAEFTDRTDGEIAHLDGLNLSRAWCWKSIAAALDEPRRTVALRAADRHLAASLTHVAGDYMGEHWLASFALLALSA